MAAKRKPVVRRTQFADEKYLGSEPDLRGDEPATDLQLMRAYNWYNYFYDAEDAKKFALAYCREQKFPKRIVDTLAKADATDFGSVGWNCRMLSLGANLPTDLLDRMRERMKGIAASVVAEASVAKPSMPEVVQVSSKSIQERLAEKLGRLKAEIDSRIDAQVLSGAPGDWRVADYIVSQGIKPAMAQEAAGVYRVLLDEIDGALRGECAQLREAYAAFAKKKLRQYRDFVGTIVADLEAVKVAVKAPRRAKPKTPAQLTRKVRFKPSDDKYNVKSISPTEIVGATQLWVFDPKRRILGMYNTSLASGFTVKGTTLVGWDTETSVGKKLRKPEIELPKLLGAGKVQLRKFMDNIDMKPRALSGRFNPETILLRAQK